ncbi:MAG: NADPH:quinone oxidoreductase family protein [Rhodobacteraceae bacterium]|nr:NADPH:quinone oxidoreductase family protein [Paracoccaceae bacterium]
MRCILVDEPGKPPRLAEVEPPRPGPGEVALEIRATGLNFADLLMVAGTYQEKPPLPFVPGMELCGVVTALGEGVREPAVGTRVIVFAGNGGLAEAGCFPAAQCVSVPDTMSDEVAAGFAVAYGTSHVALAHRAKLSQGERLVVLGAAGGVGLTAVELGHAMGAEVIACARGTDRLKAARTAGAHHLIDTDTADLREAIRSLGGADVVYDPVGGAQFTAALRACNPEARLIPMGFASGEIPQIPANILLVKNLTVIGLYWGGYMRFAPHVVRDSLETLFAWHGEGRLKPHISHVLPLEQAVTGMELLRSRKATGKVVITMQTG